MSHLSEAEIMKLINDNERLQAQLPMECGHARRFLQARGPTDVDPMERTMPVIYVCSECGRIRELERSLAEWKEIAIGEREAHEGMREHRKALERRAEEAERSFHLAIKERDTLWALLDEAKALAVCESCAKVEADWENPMHCHACYCKVQAENAALLAQVAVLRELRENAKGLAEYAIGHVAAFAACDHSSLWSKARAYLDAPQHAVALQPSAAEGYVAVRREEWENLKREHEEALKGMEDAMGDKPLVMIRVSELERLKRLEVMPNADHGTRQNSGSHVDAGDAHPQVDNASCSGVYSAHERKSTK